MKTILSKKWRLGLIVLLVVGWAQVVSAAPVRMHVMEGFLPLGWALFWWALAIPFWVIGLRQVRTVLREQPEKRIYLGLAGGFIFILSALKIPSVTGSSSHPTGTGLSTMLFGPFVTAILGTVALIFQALLIAHGGISTLGANAMSMAIGGPLIAYFLIWRPLAKIEAVPFYVRVFLVAFAADLIAYLITTTQLAMAFPDPFSGFVGSWLKFAAIFAVTQIPLAIGEGILSVLVMNALQANADQELIQA